MGNFYYSSDFDGFFSFDSSHWQLSVVCQQIFCISNHFSLKGSKGEKIQFHIWKIFNFHLILIGFFSKSFLMENETKNNTSFEDNTGQNDHLSCHIMVFPALYCIQNFTVSSTLLCPTPYCVQQNTVSTLTQKDLLFTFQFQRAEVVSCCTCKTPQFKLLYIFEIEF